MCVQIMQHIAIHMLYDIHNASLGRAHGRQLKVGPVKQVGHSKSQKTLQILP